GALTGQVGRPFRSPHQRGLLSLPYEDEEASMYQKANVTLVQAGYEHYKTSNFAPPGNRSVHNLSYWENGEWLGLGPGAHGYWSGRRYANVRGPAEWAARLERGELPYEWTREVGRDEAMDDTMIFGLRLLEGVSVPSFVRRLGADPG